jgi:AP-1 complex subunit beta-1
MASSSLDREHKGDVQELKNDLYDPKRTKKALRKMASHASMLGTPVGAPNVSVLLPDVMHCLEAPDIEDKKAVYLFLSALSSSNADATTIAFNRISRDVSASNPLIRALALRTLTSVRTESMAEGMVEPIRIGLHDQDPFVRKIAALSVAKVFDLSPETVEAGKLIPQVTELLEDSNPHVVANAATALSEIRQRAPFSVFELKMSTATKILAALNECTEWSQVSLLDTLILFSPSSEKEAITILERVVPRLNHSNAAVVMSAIKVMLYHVSLLSSQETARSFTLKLAQPLCTLMSLQPDIQYTCLRNLKLIIQKYPSVLSSADVKIFYCKYNDPSYVKVEKLDIMIALATSENVHLILSELKEYCHDVDGDFGRKAMQAVSKCAVNFEQAVDYCVKIVLEAIRDKVPVVLQEAVVVVQTIFRRYPNKYESIISDVCTNLDEIDEPGAKAALIWVIGEYSDRIDAAEELLEVFFESYSEEESQVQLALLTALSKLYLNVESDKSVDMLQELLGITNDTVDDPDVRDRALFYWRVIAGDLDVARQVILAPKAPIESKILEELDPKLLSILAKRISCASSVFFKRPSAFVSYKNLYACPNEFKDTGVLHGEGDEPAMEQKPFQNGHNDEGGSSEREGEKKEEAKPPVDLLGDLLSLDVVTPSTTAPTQVPMPMPMNATAAVSPFAQNENNFFAQQQQQQQSQGHGFFQETQAFPQAGEAAFPKPTNTNSNNPFF